MRAPSIALVLGAALLGMGVAPAPAALPAADATVEAHNHGSNGRNYHVQFKTGSDPRRLESVLVYSEQCGETFTQEDVPVGEDGRVTAGAAVDGGSWELSARFTAPKRATGTFRVRTEGCDSGTRAFRARRAANARERAAHGGHGGHGGHGPKFPPIGRATAAQRRQAEQLRKQVWRVARERFGTYRGAKRRGFVRYNRSWGRPVVFHLRSARYDADRTILRASRPESLVYWWPRRGAPILLGFMFRVPAPKRPAFGGPIPIYHRHPGKNGLGRTQMTHVWLTRDLRSAWANCLPVDELERAHPGFEYSKQGNGNSGVEARPCTPQAPVRTPDTHTVAVGDNWFVGPEDGVPTLTVRRGDVIRWDFVGRSPHNVSVADGPARFESPVKREGSFRRTLDRKGTYRLVCTIHGGKDQAMRVEVR